MLELLRTFLIKINSEIDDLYHSKNEDYKHLKLASVFLVIYAAILFVTISFISDDNLIFIIGKYLFSYMICLFLWYAIIIFISHCYIFGKSRKNNFSKTVYKFLLVLSFLVSIPMLLLILAIDTIKDYRAKKIDNLINLILILGGIIITIILLGCCNQLLILKVITILSHFLASYGIESTQKFEAIILLLIIYKAEVDILSFVIFKLIKKFKTVHIEKLYKVRDEMNNTKILNDGEVIDDNITLKDAKKKLEYDLDYYKKSIWKIELAFLIISYVVAASTTNIFLDVSSEIKDAITVITLWMLYWDKRKEWK